MGTKNSMKIFFFLFFLLGFMLSHGQSERVDSLLNLLPNTKQDTVRAKILLALASDYNDIGKLTEAKKYGNRAIDLCEKLNYKKGIAIGFGNLGVTYQFEANYDSAIVIYNKALIINENLNNKIGMATMRANLGQVYRATGDLKRSVEEIEKALAINVELNRKAAIADNYSNIAIGYYYKSDFPNTLEFFLKSLKIFEEINDKGGIESSINNIGVIYAEQKDYKNALDYFEKALKLNIAAKNKLAIGASYYNIGGIYLQERKFDLAIKYMKKGLAINKETGQKAEICSGYCNIGSALTEKGEYEEALKYCRLGYSIAKEIKNQRELSTVANALSRVFMETNRLDSALHYANIGLNSARESGVIENLKEANKNLSSVYEKLKKPALAFEYYKTFITLRDSISNKEKTQELTRKTMNFEFEKEKEKEKAEQERRDFAYSSSKKQQQILFFSVAFVLFLVSIFSLFLYRRYRLTTAQKQIIENQKLLVEEKSHQLEEKNKDIIDSITYAKRLQEAILPSRRSIDNVFPENFIFYKPKDIVAGDFYWMHTSSDNSINLIAAADCTGHGVPGALVSVVCSSALNRSVNEFGLTDPGQILDKTRDLVLETFDKTLGEVNDGMDISLAAVKRFPDSKKVIVNWAGANNSLWYVNNKELKEIKGDKQPIGKYILQKPFTTQTLELDEHDAIYLFSDGFADQFGGGDGKKFKLKQMKDLFRFNSNNSLKEQERIFDETFAKWKGKLEQVDDILVIGVRV